MRMTHTGVPRELEGRGIAAALVETALTWAREQGYKVVPLCSYVRRYIGRHPEWQDLVA
jgi:predicted GNAT family acetyltransferase